MKNQLRIFLTFLLCLCACLCFGIAAYADGNVIASGECGAQGDNLTWTLDEDGSLTISGEGEMANCGAVSWHKQIIRSVTIKNGVTNIGESAFYGCNYLTNVIIPESVTRIGYAAFHGCSSLASVTIPESVTYIDGWAFSECGLISVTIPQGVTCISNNSFSNCGSLTSITIPEGVTSIGDFAFDGCSNLMDITIPDSVTRIDEAAFSHCSSLKRIIIPEGVSHINGETFFDCTNMTSVTIPESVTRIDNSAFYGCRSLTAVTIPARVTCISDSVFGMCSSLASIVIPEGVTNIERFAFDGCKSLSTVTIPDSVTNISEYAFRNCVSLSSVTIPDRVTSIGEAAFTGCKSLKSVTIPEGIISIEKDTFYECSSLMSVTIPNSVKSISEEAFPLCTSLKSVTIPAGVKNIGNWTFYGCSSLTSVTIPDSVTTIGRWAFSGCNSLSDIYYSGTSTQWGSIAVEYDNQPINRATIHYNYIISIGSDITHGVVTAEKDLFAFGETVSLTITPDTGYVLDTLTVKQGETEVSVTDNTFLMPEGDVIVSATFKPIVYTITWKNDDGSTLDETLAEYGTVPTHAAPEKAATAEYTYAFADWTPALTEAFGDATYTATFTAQRITHIVTFDANGGSNAPESQVKGAGLDLVLSSAIPEREEEIQNIPVTLNATGGLNAGSTNPLRMTAARYTNYRFVGWNTTADGTGTDYTPGAAFTEDRDATLYAQWSAASENTPVSLPIPVRDGFFFLGWAESADADSGKVGYYMPENKTTLYALWGQPDFILPAALTEISDEAFSGGAFTFVQLPDNAISIGANAFAACRDLKYIIIPASIKNIDSRAFDAGVTILGITGTPAYSFAQANNFDFIPLR